MNFCLEIFMNGILCLAAIQVQVTTLDTLRNLSDLRWNVASSDERCPSTIDTPCKMRISARSYGRWEACDRSHPPSGADLPMHRWFRVTGRCPVVVGPFKFEIPVPVQLVYR